MSAIVLGSRWYLTAGLIFTAIAIYGSLVPFTYQSRPWDEAVRAFAQIQYLQLGVGSRADFVANILLFVPLGFFFMGALRVDRCGAVGAAVAGVAVTLTCAALSLAIEFTQLFFPPRTVSINDIVAETVGACIGVAIWALAGSALTEWVRRFLVCRERAGLVVHLLTLYAALFVLAEMLPLDVTISVADLVDKHRQGRFVLVPFSYAYEAPMLALWDWAADVLLHIPLGVLGVVGWTRPGQRRGASDAFALGFACVVFVEAAQLFVFSRFSDVTDLFIGAAGVALGIALTAIVVARSQRTDAPAEAEFPLWSFLGAVVWVGVLAAYHWYPFDFVVNRAAIEHAWSQMFAAPFSLYYWGSEFQAFTQISRKLLLGVPLGVFMRLAAPASVRPAVARLQAAMVFVPTFLVLFGIEVGQILLPERIADFTDVCIAQAGVMLGFVVCGAVTMSTRTRPVESPSW